MKRFMHFVGIVVLAVTVAILSASDANAGRTGGSSSWMAVVPAYRTVTYNISFDAGAPAIISVGGSNMSDLSVVVTDASGNHWSSSGLGPLQVVRFDVIQSGYFRVEIRNTGTIDNLFVIRTN